MLCHLRPLRQLEEHRLREWHGLHFPRSQWLRDRWEALRPKQPVRLSLRPCQRRQMGRGPCEQLGSLLFHLEQQRLFHC